jgi:acyl-coenzyme A thioesterase PaaI-like protein
VSELRSVRNSPLCFGCGPATEAGLQLTFATRPDGSLESCFTPREIHGGWEGVFHGGLMATLLDEAMLAYLYRQGIRAATAELTVRDRKPVRIGQELVVVARETGRRGRLIEMEARAERAGQVVAAATARCLSVPD